jgi:hypothetical protein
MIELKTCLGCGILFEGSRNTYYCSKCRKLQEVPIWKQIQKENNKREQDILKGIMK